MEGYDATKSVSIRLADENDGNWAIFAKVSLSDEAKLLKKLNCKMKIEKSSLA